MPTTAGTQVDGPTLGVAVEKAFMMVHNADAWCDGSAVVGSHVHGSGQLAGGAVELRPRRSAMKPARYASSSWFTLLATRCTESGLSMEPSGPRHQATSPYLPCVWFHATATANQHT